MEAKNPLHMNDACLYKEILISIIYKAASQAKVSNGKKQKGQSCQKILLRTENMMKISMTEMTLQ